MKTTKSVIILSGLFALCAWAGAGDGGESQTLAIRAGKIYTMTGEPISEGVILVGGKGKITDVRKGKDVPADVKLLDMSDKSVMPGMIDAHCHIGLSLDIFSEIDEITYAVTADMQIIDAFDPLAEDVRKALNSGVTTVMLAPGDKNPIAGQTAVVKLYGETSEQRIVRSSAGIKFSVKNDTLMYDRRPTSRAGLLELIEQQLDDAKSYKRGGRPDLCAEVLNRVVQRKLPVYISANAVDEILCGMAVIEKYNLNAVLVGAGRSDEIADIVAEKKIPVIVGPMVTLSKDRDLKRIGTMADKGVRLAFASFGPRTALSDLRTSAILAVKAGMSEEVAMKALTVEAARMLGVSHRVGIIAKGKDADLAIFSGNPLQAKSTLEMVIINGDIVYQRQGK